MAKFRKIGTTEMRPYIPGEDLTTISVINDDRAVLEGPNPRGMIATGDKPTDRWYVDQVYFDSHYEACREVVP